MMTIRLGSPRRPCDMPLEEATNHVRRRTRQSIGTNSYCGWLDTDKWKGREKNDAFGDASADLSVPSSTPAPHSTPTLHTQLSIIMMENQVLLNQFREQSTTISSTTLLLY